MSKNLVEDFFNEYNSGKERRLRVAKLAKRIANIKHETASVGYLVDAVYYVKHRWKDSAAMYDEELQVKELNLKLLAHIQKHAHSMSPELLAYLMRR